MQLNKVNKPYKKNILIMLLKLTKASRFPSLVSGWLQCFHWCYIRAYSKAQPSPTDSIVPPTLRSCNQCFFPEECEEFLQQCAEAVQRCQWPVYNIKTAGNYSSIAMGGPVDWNTFPPHFLSSKLAFVQHIWRMFTPWDLLVFYLAFHIIYLDCPLNG